MDSHLISLIPKVAIDVDHAEKRISCNLRAMLSWVLSYPGLDSVEIEISSSAVDAVSFS